MQKLKLYLSLLFVLFLACTGGIAWLVNTTTPVQTNYVLLFYGLVGLGGFAIATLLGFFLRRIFGQREFLGLYVSAASRQGAWLGVILIISLVLVHQNLFSWLNAGFLVLAFIFFESFLLVRNKSNNPND